MQNTGSLTVFKFTMNQHIIQNSLFSVYKHLHIDQPTRRIYDFYALLFLTKCFFTHDLKYVIVYFNTRGKKSSITIFFRHTAQYIMQINSTTKILQFLLFTF